MLWASGRTSLHTKTTTQPTVKNVYPEAQVTVNTLLFKANVMESRFVETVDPETLRCTICPRMCTLKQGQTGFCGTKQHLDGRIISSTYGMLNPFAVDPIEKKPLAHFHPGSLALSVSSVGCSFTCPWCQNWHISTTSLKDSVTKFVEPAQVVDAAKRNRCTSIAYTYNEPLINLNYVEDTGRLAHETGIKNVLVTNGYVTEKALDRVVDVIDAANVDWKGFTDRLYREHCSGELQPVLDATEYMKSHGVHIEVTFLIIPETNDTPEETRAMARYIREHLGPDTPLHLSRFHPDHKFTHVPATPVETLTRSRRVAMEEGLRYVFVGNVPGRDSEDTVCPGCGAHVVQRTGYRITGWRLDERNHCRECGQAIPIVGGQESHGSGRLW